MSMDAAEKKRIANEKRLKAVHQWKNRNQQSIKIEPASIKKNFVLTEKINVESSKLTLFDSDGEDNDYEDNFKIRPQFEGEMGQQLLEMSSELSSRFKLDERFKDDEEVSEIAVADGNEEKIKNIRILESVLGYEVSEKHPEGKQNSTKKRHIMRFDPEDESATKYLKTSHVPEEQSQSKVRRKKASTLETKDEKEEIPISNERYIEVSSNLKDLLSSSKSSTPFTLSEKFSNEVDNEIDDGFSFSFSRKEDAKSIEKIKKIDGQASKVPPKTKNIFENRRNFLFFISENDDQLKEGLDFFRRPNTLEKIQEDWNKKKENVMELFRRKRKSNQRGFVNRIKASEKNKAYAKK